MKNITSTNPKEFLKLFSKWNKELPYCTAGRPCYGGDEYKQAEEVIEIEFLWYDIPSKIRFERLVGGSTNFHWGLRDFGRKTTITIGDIVINTDKTISTESWQYRNRVVTKRTSLVEAPLKRILTGLREGFKTHPFTDPIVYLTNREKWVTMQYVCDFNKNINEFCYFGKYTPQDDRASTWLIPFHTYEIDEEIAKIIP